MASGDPVLESMEIVPPAASAAQWDVRAGGSTPAENFTVYAFDDTTDEYVDIKGRLGPNYDGGGLTLRLPWAAASATTDDVKWDAAIRRIADDAEDIDTAHTYVFNTVTDTAPSASGELTDAVITFTDGADMDSLAAGELFILRIRRDADDAADTMTGDAQLSASQVALRET